MGAKVNVMVAAGAIALLTALALALPLAGARSVLPLAGARAPQPAAARPTHPTGPKHPTKPKPKPALKVAIGSVSLDGHNVTILGHLSRAVTGVQIRLQDMTPGPRWPTVATTSPRGPKFRLRWTVPASRSGAIMARAQAVARGHVLATSDTVIVPIAPPPTLCAKPSPAPAYLPPGDGVITGGNYIVGGPAPGIDACSSASYTVTATTGDESTTVASQTVAGGDSYTLVLPAGSYTLTANNCSTYNPVVVKAGKTTKADVDCDVP